MSDNTEGSINIVEKAHELDALFCNHAKITQFEQFFSKNEESLIQIFRESICCDNLFSINFISAVDVSYVRRICIFLCDRPYISHFSKMCSCASIIMSNDISKTKKAMFWNVLQQIYTNSAPEPFLAQDIFMDNDAARTSLLLYYQKGNPKHDFIKDTRMGKKNFPKKDSIEKGILEDSVSIFEMHRQMAGRDITITMLLTLLQFNAVKCFLHLLTHFPKKVYKCRSAELWLFTVCRNCPPETAIPIIQAIEEDHSGMVGSALDPWGNSLLWNSCANRDWSVDEMQKVLIDLGCDPDAENQWGLSFRLVQENKLGFFNDL